MNYIDTATLRDNVINKIQAKYETSEIMDSIDEYIDSVVRNHIEEFAQYSDVSYKARSIYAAIKVLKGKASIVTLRHLGPDGVESIRSGINELIEKGLIERTRKQSVNGFFEGYEYRVL